MYESTEGALKIPRLHARAASALLAGMVGVEIGYAWWGLKLRGMLDPTSGQITDPGFLDHAALGETLDTLGLVGTLVTGVVFVAWMYKAYQNMPALGPVSSDYAPGKAIYGWLIPIMNMIMPYQVIRELWDGTDPARGESYHRTDGKIVVVWWASWLCMSATHWGLRFSSEPTTVSELRSQAMFVVVAGVVSAVSACLAIAVVRRTTARLEACEGPRAQAL